jgi:CRP/FNR family transcriptional regulator, cyclic AMP receptor protein
MRMVDVAFLHNIHLFRSLDPKQVELIRGLLKEENYRSGEKVIEEGRAGESLYIVRSGKLRVSRAFDTETFVLTELGPNDFFGEMSLIDDFAASATVETLTDSSLLKMTREDFKALVGTSSELSSRLWESLARSLNTKIRKTGDLVKMYYGLNKALCENEQVRQLYTSWNFHMDDK